MADQLYILKIGGRVTDNQEQLNLVLDDFTKIQGPKILVHGGGNKASELSEKLGIKPKMINGRRITNLETLDVVTMIYAGLVNKDLVVRLQSKNVNAIGLSGADGNSILAKKRPVGEIDYGFAGDLPDKAQVSESLLLMLNNGLTPVFCALTHDGNGQLLNTNADTIASYLAKTLSASYTVKLVYCLDKPGVLLDKEDNSTVINELGPAYYQDLISDQTIQSGMIPKLDNAFSALRLGVNQIYLCDWKDVSGESGTKITLA